jgi:hypothetical protein
MDAIQTLSKEIASLVSGNEIYETYRSRWKYYLESYMGGEEYRRGQHLTKYQLETDTEYQARLLTTPLENHCQSVVSVYNSFLFREHPTRVLPSIESMPEFEEFLRDSDYEGRDLDSFMKEVATWSSVFGHCWVMVAKPNVGANTRAAEQQMGVRPYVSLLTPMVVLDWQWHRDESGRYRLDYLRYVEDINGDIRVLKEWTLDTITTTRVNVSTNVVLETIVDVNQLNTIPAVCVYNQRGPVRGLGISDITDISDLQKFIYNCTSEVDQSIRLDSHPSLVKTPETQAGIGAGSIIHMPENLDPGLKPYVLEFSGASITSIQATIQHAVSTIDKLANIGAVRATEAKTMSGVAMQTEFQLLNARLSEKADNLELAEEQIWRLWAMYMGREYDGVIEYPGSFNIRDTETEIAQLKTAKETLTDPQALRAVDRKVLEWMGVDPDEVLVEAPTPVPVTGRTYENGEPIDPRLPEAYRNATGESQQCENCQFYNPETFACSAFGGAPVRPMWVCARWQDIE